MTTRTSRTPRRARTSPGTGASVHRLPEGPEGWRLDDHTVEIARVGIARAREALRLARLAVAEREGGAVTPNSSDHAAAA